MGTACRWRRLHVQLCTVQHCWKLHRLKDGSARFAERKYCRTPPCNGRELDQRDDSPASRKPVRARKFAAPDISTNNNRPCRFRTSVSACAIKLVPSRRSRPRATDGRHNRDKQQVPGPAHQNLRRGEADHQSCNAVKNRYMSFNTSGPAVCWFRCIPTRLAADRKVPATHA
jgi:hypothetical protein